MARASAQTPSKLSGRVYTIAAIAFAVIGGLLAFAVLQSSGGGGTKSAPVDTIKIVVAAKEIPALTKISAGMLTTKDVSAKSAVAGAYNQSEPLVGLVALYPIAEGEQMTPQKLGLDATGQRDSRKGLSFVVPEGKRAVGITVTEQSGVAGLIVAGDRVDVVALISKELAGAEKASTILQDVEVLAVAQVSQDVVPPSVAASPTAAPAENKPGTALGTTGQRPLDPKPQPQARTVTLALTPDQVQLIALAQKYSELYLSLRPFAEKTTVTIPASDLLPIGVLPVNQRPRQ